MSLTPAADGKLLGGRIGPVGHLVINNPERRNAIDLDMWRHAASVLDELAADSLVFEQAYATGTRTVRGLEAVTLSLPPTRANCCSVRTRKILDCVPSGMSATSSK